mgnify:CR=1 FL=1
MKKLEITKIVLSKEDIITCIKNELIRQGLKPTKDININIGSRLVGFGMGARPETYIQDTTIECEKV